MPGLIFPLGAQGLPSRNRTTLGCRRAVQTEGRAGVMVGGRWMDRQTDVHTQHGSISLAEAGCCPPLPAP